MRPTGEGSLVQATDLWKTYRASGVDSHVLRGASLTIERGAFVALLGPSGCGKSTLLGLLGGLDSADSGTILVDGLELTGATRGQLLHYRQATIGLVFQSYNLLPTLTAAENVEVGLAPLALRRAERRARVEVMLARVGLGDAAGKFPAQLSGGEQQRVAIARGLAKHPALVVADEPTGALDSVNGEAVIALIRELNEQHGVAFIVATHDPNVARWASSILRMENGRFPPTAEASGAG